MIEKEDNPRYWRDGKPGNEVDGPWQRQFLDCLKTNSPPPVTMDESQSATVCCHLANIAYRVGRSINWNDSLHQITDDVEADRMRSRARRQGYELPRF